MILPMAMGLDSFVDVVLKHVRLLMRVIYDDVEMFLFVLVVSYNVHLFNCSSGQMLIFYPDFVLG